jgi:hypothetical protein
VKTYQGIQNELAAMESSSIVFKIRMGQNRTNTSGEGNVFSLNVGQVDINIGTTNGLSTMQIMAHELLHGYQYLNGDLDFGTNGGGGYLYDQTDEIAAYTRQNLFADPTIRGSIVDPNRTVLSNYPNLSNQKKSYDSLLSPEKAQYDKAKKNGIYH